jgi:RND superfamily putative drug exporter
MFSTANLARSSAAHPWRTIGIWVVILVLSFVTMGILGDQTTTEINFTDDPESQVGLELLTDAGLADDNPTDETLIVHAESGTVDDAAFRTRVEEITNALRNMPGIVVPETVTNFYELSANEATAAVAPGLVSENRQTTLIPLTLAGNLDEAMKNAPAYLEDVEALAGNGFELTSVGYVSIGEENNIIAEEDLIQGETIGIIAAIVILVIVFGALVAAGIPILVAIVSIMVAFGISTLIGSVWELSFFVTNMITMIGLAVGIDYTLFVVERYREERRQGRAKPDAIGIAGSTASKAVAFSGATVVLALLGMLLLPNSIFKALGIGAIAVVVVSVFATLTFIPAVISLLGDKMDWPRKPKYENYSATHALANPHSLEAAHSGFWGRVTRAVTARPIISVVASSGFLILCAIPYLDINTGFAGVETMPEDSHVRQGFEILTDEFSAGRLAPVQFAIDGDQASAQAGVDKLITALGTETVPDGDGTRPAFLPIDPANAVKWNEDGTVGLLEVTLNISSNEDRAYKEIQHLRSDLVPTAFQGTGAEVYVTGETAFNQDFFDQVETYTPYVLAFVLGLSFILLLLAFRSIVVSAKAIVMNLLSVGAAYGLFANTMT